MNRREFLRIAGGGAAASAMALLFPMLVTADNPYPANIAQFITPDFKFLRETIRKTYPQVPRYHFLNTTTGDELRIGKLPSNYYAAQWWVLGRGQYAIPSKAYMCKSSELYKMHNFIQSYIRAHQK